MCDASLTSPAGHHGVVSSSTESETVKPVTASLSCGGMLDGLTPDPGSDSTPVVGRRQSDASSFKPGDIVQQTYFVRDGMFMRGGTFALCNFTY